MNTNTSLSEQTNTEAEFFIADGHQLPFRFCAIPHTVIDDEYFSSDPLDYLVLSKVARFIALDQHQVVNGQRLKSGWSIPINQQSLATKCKVRRETITRKLKSLESEGYIESRQIGQGRNKVYRLTAYVVSKAQVQELQNNVPQANIEPSDDQMTVPKLVGFTAEKRPKKATCDPENTLTVTHRSHLLIDNSLTELTSSTSYGTCEAEITPSAPDPDLESAKQAGLDEFANAKGEINQPIAPGGRKRIKTNDLDRFISDLCDSYSTISPVQAMEILQRCAKIKKLPTACPSNDRPIGSPLWYLNRGHENYLIPALVEMGLIKKPSVPDKSQAKPSKSMGKFGLEAGGRGKIVESVSMEEKYPDAIRGKDLDDFFANWRSDKPEKTEKNGQKSDDNNGITVV